MSARDDLVYRITRHCSAETAEQLVDAHRTEVLAKAVGRLRAIPVTCTALTGPVWYGDGWNSAITCLEEIAEYQTPDDEAYPGELQMLRALALGIRVAARKADMDEVQRIALDHAARDGDERDKVRAGTALDFFQSDRTYERRRWLFQCLAVGPDPFYGETRAVGYLFRSGRPASVITLGSDEWAHGGWAEVGVGGGSDG
jgi:hypothetical protein